MLARIAVPGGGLSFTYETDSMATDGGFRRYSKLLAQKSSVTGTVFLSTLFPWTITQPQLFPAPYNNTSVSAVLHADGYHDLMFCTRDGVLQTISADSSGTGAPVKGNGKINFLSQKDDNSFSSAFIQSGDSLVAGSQTLIRTDRKLTVAWMRADNDVSAGYISDYGTLKLYSSGPLMLLRGPVTALAYDSLRHLVTVTCSGKGNFFFGPAGLTWVWTGAASSDWHDASNWQMEGHPAFSGVPGAATNVVIPAGLSRYPVISSANPATCHDLTISPGASLTLGELKYLTVEGNVVLQAGK